MRHQDALPFTFPAQARRLFDATIISTTVANYFEFKLVNATPGAEVVEVKYWLENGARVSPFKLAQEGATDGQALVWSAANQRFQPGTVSGGGGGNFIAFDVSQSLTGNQKQQALSNIGASAGSVESFTNTGVVTLNNLVITKSNIVFSGASTVTLTGIVPLWDGQEITILNLTGNILAIPYLSGSSTAANRIAFVKSLPNRGIITLKYSTTSGVWFLKSGVFNQNLNAEGAFSNEFIGIGRTPANNVGLALRSVLNTDSAFALACERLDGTRTFEVRSLSAVCFTPMGIGGVSAGSTRALTIRSLAAGGWPLEIYNFAGVSTTLFFNSGDIGMTQGIIMGAASSFSTPTARLDVRGRGTTTGLTQIWEDSAGTNNVEYVDNGQVRMLRLPTSSAGLASGSLWNNGGVINIV
jgi:hypothetical protein